jgi:AcrR family transcriptional regulator
VESTKTPEARLPLNRERVLRAAMGLADSQGLAALSMRSLATLLDVQAMSLYNHVSNKEDILDGMVELVVSEIEVPSPDHPWQVAMRARAHSAHAVLLRHPWACALLMSRVNIGPFMLRYIDATLGCLWKAGFTLPQADHAWNALDSYIYGFTLQKLNFPLKAEEYSVMAASFLPALPADRYPSMRALTELVAARQHNGLHELDFGLELILAGLERGRVDIPEGPHKDWKRQG